MAAAAATRDGKTLVYSSNKTGAMDVVIRDLTTGQERVITADRPERSKSYPVINRDASKILYSSASTESLALTDVYEVTVADGSQRRVCQQCGPTLSLSPDGKRFLTVQQDGPRSRITAVDVSTGQATVVLQHSQYPLSVARFSPAGTMVAFVVSRGPVTSEIFVAPWRDAAIPEAQWLRLSPAPGDHRDVFWSPNGGLVYYDLTSGGPTALMARRVSSDGQPLAMLFVCTNFPDAFVRRPCLADHRCPTR